MAADRPDVHGFWEAGGATKTFTHTLDLALLGSYVSRDARILDYGCGYGRLTAQLAAAGYTRVTGVDPSLAMIERGHREHPRLPLIHQAELPLPDGDGAYDAAVLFAVLNCIPDDAAQRATVAELARVLRPGGVLYVSEVPLQRDPRNVRRYDAYAAGGAGTAEAADAAGRTCAADVADRAGEADGARGPGPASAPYGTFLTPDGGLFRHHTPEHLRALLDSHGFTVTEERTGTEPTLNGHLADSLQLLARRRPFA